MDYREDLGYSNVVEFRKKPNKKAYLEAAEKCMKVASEKRNELAKKRALAAIDRNGITLEAMKKLREDL